jgi:glyoxylase-like metal-dependent hydrolase (beta-lactamase superfamily II)
MLVRSFRDPRWLSNTWLLADRPGGHAVVVDTGGPFAPLCAAVEEWGVEVTHVLCTHHHPDHVAHNADCVAAWGCPVCAHAGEAPWMQDLDRELADGEELRSGDLHVRALHLPGHTAGQLGFLVDGSHVLTGDTLFRGSIGGTAGHGHTTIEDLRHSLMDVLLGLPDETIVLPGHMDESSIGRERRENPFLRAFAGPAPRPLRRCTVRGRPAELLLEARDYDGGIKAWVRMVDDDLETVVPGSAVR